MVQTLSFTPKEATALAKKLEGYTSLPAPSKYELARYQFGQAIITIYTSGKMVIQGKSALVESAVKEKIIGMLEKESDELVFGIDEVGRGEREGPLVVSGVLGQRNAMRGLRDSKKTSDIKGKYAEATRKSWMQASVSVNAEYIDALRGRGVNLNDIEIIIANHLHALSTEFEKGALTIMDGKSMRGAAKGIVFLEKADDVEPSVSAASIVAKHTRNESGNKEERKSWKKKEE